MEELINLDEIIYNKDFWMYFFSTNFPNAFDEESDSTLGEIIRTNYIVSKTWVDKFTKYYKDVFDVNDGYVDNPKTIILELNGHDYFKIEFHPGDTIYYINDNKIGCTGPHFIIHKISWKQFKEILYHLKYLDIVIFLILPMIYINHNELNEVKEFLNCNLKLLPFAEEDFLLIEKCILENVTLYS